MGNIFWLMGKTFRNTFRKKGSWIVFFVMPIVGVLLSMLLFSNTGNVPLRIGVVNGDGNEALIRDTIGFIQGLHQVRMKELGEEELNREIAAGKLDAGLLLKPGFADSLYKGAPDGIELRSMKGAQSTAFIKAMLQQYTGNLAAIGTASEGNRDTFDKLYESFRSRSFAVTTEQVRDTSSAMSITYQGIGFLIMFMLFSASNLAQIILSEKENRTYLRLMSSPLSARVYVLSNALVSLLFLFLQIVLTLFIMKTVLGIDSGIPYWQLVSVMMVFSLVAIGLSLMLVAFSKSSGSLGAMQNLVITPTCLLAGCFFPLEIMPDAVKRVAAFMPQYWVLDAVDRLQTGDAFASLGMNAAILLAFAIVFGLIAAYRFGRNNDTRMFI